MFFSDAPTTMDLHFRFLGFEVRVQPWFWLTMALLGSDLLQLGLEYLLIWVACGFVSVLVHELGHTHAFKAFGCWSMIVLRAFGGLAIPTREPDRPWQRLLVSAAGPLAGFAFVGVVYASQLATPWPERNIYLRMIYSNLIWMGIFWNILNLFPILPLDGGSIAREFFAILRLRNPDMLAHGLSVAVAGTLCAYGIAGVMNIPVPLLDQLLFLYRPSLMMTIFLGLFAFENWKEFQRYQQQRNFYHRHDDDDSPPWRR